MQGGKKKAEGVWAVNQQGAKAAVDATTMQTSHAECDMVKK